MSSVIASTVFYLSLRDAAKRSQLSVRTLTRAIAVKQLRAYRVGRLVRIAERDLQAFIERKPIRATS
jgi:excisionase family DNA binding protein